MIYRLFFTLILLATHITYSAEKTGFTAQLLAEQKAAKQAAQEKKAAKAAKLAFAQARKSEHTFRAHKKEQDRSRAASRKNKFAK